MGLNEIENPDVMKPTEKEDNESGDIMDNRKLNEMIKNAMVIKDKGKKD